jgi:2-polyprenyl-3-methyl-5-hydroxy-6-metoxy-1,4-benzoquinol methylase
MSDTARRNQLRADALEERRLQAALASGGTSTANVHLALLSRAREIGLSGEVLDFGAGTGELTARLAASGLMLRLTAIDLVPPPSVNGEGVTWLQADLNGPVPLPAESFDAIVSAEVIEHLENPRAVFREFNRLLRPRGYLLLTTPNQESLRSLASLAVRGHFVDFLDGSYPAHITALVRRDFVRMAAETGFEPPKFSYTATGAVPAFPRVSWQDLSFGRLRGRRFSDNLLVATRKTSA